MVFEKEILPIDFSSKRAFLFDLDDTLINTSDCRKAGLKAAYSRLGSLCKTDLAALLPENEFFDAIRGEYDKKRSEEFEKNKCYETIDYTPEIFDNFCLLELPKRQVYVHGQYGALAARIYWTFKETRYATLAPNPHALSILNFLSSKGKPLYCLTQGKCNHQNTKLMLAELDGYFDEVFISEGKKEAKLSEIIKKLGIGAQDLVMVGDKAEDADAASAVGASSVRVFQGDAKNKRKEVCGDIGVNSLSELLSALKKCIA